MENLITTFHPTHFLQEYGPSSTHYYGRRCVICENWNTDRPNCMYCSICDLCFHKECEASLMENLTIDRQETHQHTLTFIRQKNSFNCVACGRVFVKDEMNRYGESEMNMYGCLPCNFYIHRDCMYLPKVIKLTRHWHRLFHTLQVPNYNTKCRLCHAPFGCGSGGYICINKTCDYKLHSYCATDKNTWDGRDLEGEPEETIYSEEDVTSLKEVDDGKMFRHFSHQHDLTRLCVNGEKKEGDERVCQACLLPVDFDSLLGCKECDFALHDTCANLPRKLEHPFHRHQLTLEVDIIEAKGFFSCSKCRRESCGFMYRCSQEECEFKMDAKCASLADPLHIGAHKDHPLTLTKTGAVCFECKFFFYSIILTLPVLVKNKHDTHPLTLFFNPSYDAFSVPFPCEICEKRINPDYPFFQVIYGCFDCNTVVHVECALGKYPYLKPGHTIKLNGFEIEIASNSLSRPICHACHSICQDKLVFKNKSSAISFCSINCITSS